MAICDAAATKIGPPVRGAEPMWSCVEATRAAGNGDFAAGMATEKVLFSRVSSRALPSLALIGLALPCLALPCLFAALPCLALPCLALPFCCLALPNLAVSVLVVSM